MHKILHLIAKIDKDGSKCPKWMLLFKAGLGKLSDGVEFLIDETAFTLIKAFINARGNEVHFDYEHASLEKAAAPASGWIKELTWDAGVGIKARVEWTDKASEYIENREYRYFSPVFYIRKSDKRVCGLDSVALTNRPRTTNLTPILAKLSAEAGFHEETTMDRKQLIAALGLEANATDADIMTAIAKAGVKLPEAIPETKEVIPKAVTAALDLKETDGESVVVASIHALKQYDKTAVSREEFLRLENELKQRDAAEAVAAALAKGKITPEQTEWAKGYAASDLNGFNAFVAKAPQVIPVGDLPGRTKTQAPAAGEITDTDLEIAAMMDISIEDLKKYGMEVTNG